MFEESECAQSLFSRKPMACSKSIIIGLDNVATNMNRTVTKEDQLWGKSVRCGLGWGGWAKHPEASNNGQEKGSATLRAGAMKGELPSRDISQTYGEAERKQGNRGPNFSVLFPSGSSASASLDKTQQEARGQGAR